MGKRREKTLSEKLEMAARYSCATGCQGRCEVCPAEVEQEAIAELSRLSTALEDAQARLSLIGAYLDIGDTDSVKSAVDAWLAEASPQADAPKRDE